jgi:transposase
MFSYGCQQILINPDSNLKAILEFVCGESTKLGNCGTYYSRQLYFKTGRIPTKYDLHKELATNPHFKALHSQVAQQCLTTIAESFKSYLGLLKAFWSGTIDQKPKLPKRGLYRSSNGTKINADCNGAGNIIRKVAATLGINLDGVSSGALKTPVRVRLWIVNESPALANQSACGLEA